MILSIMVKVSKLQQEWLLQSVVNSQISRTGWPTLFHCTRCHNKDTAYAILSRWAEQVNLPKVPGHSMMHDRA